uniref:Uncharacterized protein n=1 Tax=Lactuca sativa TaxID=4236 RepID=A0A9R1WEP2_LACSA|nr:hypothetical protein LSAT_V11C100048190 [Lactuca sativa]
MEVLSDTTSDIDGPDTFRGPEVAGMSLSMIAVVSVDGGALWMWESSNFTSKITKEDTFVRLWCKLVELVSVVDHEASTSKDMKETNHSSLGVGDVI